MRKLIISLAVVIGMMFGGLVSPVPAHAAGPLHQFFYDSSGIQHNVGKWDQRVLSYQGTILGNRDIWQAWAPVVTTAVMWYGPKSTLVANGNVEVCWLYINPVDDGPADVTFDFTTGSTPTVLWSVHMIINPTPGWDPMILRKLCHTLAMFGTFAKFQVRVRVEYTAGISEVADSLRVYKTTYQDTSY